MDATGYQTTLPKAAEAGEVVGDAIPVRGFGLGLRSVDGEQAMGGERNVAAIGDVEGEKRIWRERFGKGDGGFDELAGVVGVAVEDAGGEVESFPGEADGFKMQRGGKLERNLSERGRRRRCGG